jgi:hypothetical protein
LFVFCGCGFIFDAIVFNGPMRIFGDYPKNQRRPDIRELNVHIYRYFFAVEAMAEYLGVSRQALKRRIDRMPYDMVMGRLMRGRRFEGRRIVCREIMYYEWRTFYYLSLNYSSIGARYVQRVFYPRSIMRNFHVAVMEEGIFVPSMFID